MARRGDLQDVELVEDDGGPAPDAPRSLGLTLGRSLPRRWLAAGAVVVAAAVGVSQWVATTREDAAVARLSQVPGVLAPVDDVLEVGRPVTDAEAEPLPTSGGATTLGADGSLAYRWVGHPGDAGWSTPLLPADARLAGAAHVRSASDCRTDVAVAADPASATRVVCLVADGGVLFTGDGEVERVPTTAVSVVVLSVADGSVETRWPVPDGEALAVMPGGLVAVGALRDRTAVVTGYDLLTGTERWTYEQDGTQLTGGDGFGGPTVSLVRAGDLLALVPPGRSTVLLSTSGERVRGGLVDPEASAWGVAPDARTGRLVVSSDTVGGSSRSTFVAPDGDEDDDLVLDGHPLHVVLDDRSVPGTALTADDESVHAAGVGSRGGRWSVHVDRPGFALVVRGRVIVASAHGVTAVDGRSGNVLWRSADQDGLAPGNLMTDGRHVLVAYERTGSDAHAAVVAYDPASGQEAFRAAYPDGVEDVNPVGRHLVGTDADGQQVLLD